LALLNSDPGYYSETEMNSGPMCIGISQNSKLSGVVRIFDGGEGM
jgi:hypothetical protein